MSTRKCRYLAWCGWLGIQALLLAGCGSPPAPRQTVRMRDLTTPAARQAAANHFWLRANVPDLRGLGYRRVAIAEFVVEFVTAKRERTADLTDYLRENPDLQRRARGDVQNIELIYQNQYDYPARLYRICCDELTRRGFEVVPTGTLIAASAYRRFETESGDTTIDLKDSYASGSDTGRVRRLSLRTLPGLAIIRGGGDQDVETIEEALRQELQADVLLRVRVRVGTFSGHATLERGSVVHVVAPHVSGSILAERSLISDEAVIAESSSKLGGLEARVNLSKYQRALDVMFPVYIEMAFDSADVAPRPESVSAARP